MVFFPSQKLESFKDRFFEENQEIPFFEKLIKNFVIFLLKKHGKNYFKFYNLSPNVL